ncbi:hypothetical protein JTE90_003726 [Oedothorax gibbosus]|uniref:Chitin-binding type-2 domain-containing protein n=1 Tax=Oedothorax gibbosus TaxID=931172 RepID=A0AAV6VA25_9ARAC|nr:hypothetical protein JTE90_003726 [Oedothorax gibbosus]
MLLKERKVLLIRWLVFFGGFVKETLAKGDGVQPGQNRGGAHHQKGEPLGGWDDERGTGGPPRVPDTSFDCRDRAHPGYYADPEAGCQAFHVCQSDGRRHSFVCPGGTLFNQATFVCDWWFNVECALAPALYARNAHLHRGPRVGIDGRDTQVNRAEEVPAWRPGGSQKGGPRGRNQVNNGPGNRGWTDGQQNGDKGQPGNRDAFVSGNGNTHNPNQKGGEQRPPGGNRDAFVPEGGNSHAPNQRGRNGPHQKGGRNEHNRGMRMKNIRQGPNAGGQNENGSRNNRQFGDRIPDSHLGGQKGDARWNGDNNLYEGPNIQNNILPQPQGQVGGRLQVGGVGVLHHKEGPGDGNFMNHRNDMHENKGRDDSFNNQDHGNGMHHEKGAQLSGQTPMNGMNPEFGPGMNFEQQNDWNRMNHIRRPVDPRDRMQHPPQKDKGSSFEANGWSVDSRHYKVELKHQRGDQKLFNGAKIGDFPSYDYANGDNFNAGSREGQPDYTYAWN